ncbi:MAG: ribbon-helix-helix protein, CopG family [Spirochaetaceae bacterium]|nr:ribbon-helix-helix protein, CopG family [Spirochaetaceae bacterium]
MKVKTSITLSDDLLDEIDRRSDEFRSRSEFLETAARGFLRQLARTELEERDLSIINRRADALNAEAEDVLSYQAPL